eukprot:gb/GECG01007694.1/.p1 GENE.gb/GECG01007694.1/~~gb/GECG01007694.1/.p1  ORF type:complete len:411 (+),score=45.56 gb/GECG01007694.1/:1-1233(+)
MQQHLSRAVRRCTAAAPRIANSIKAVQNGPLSTLASRGFASEANATFDLTTPHETHLCDGPSNTSTATKEELLSYHELMYIIRRMEITCDNEYKARNIRGFCHLSDGQEAVAAGLRGGITFDDDITTAYRCHGISVARGDTPSRVFAELFGFSNGSSRGKGGSMHLYSKKNRFWGGFGIVGGQVPVGCGVGFANKYRTKGQWPSTVSVVMYGDGAANQGQVWEAANMSKLWNLPNILVCENNKYGMGTSINRHSCNPDYYKQGGVAIPGVRCDGMDVLAVKECFKWAKEFAGNGNGPLFVETVTYRYHGHSMSDPGLTYRTREEVQDIRQNRDPIELLKSKIMDAGFATEQELKEKEKELRNYVQDELKAAKEGQQPPLDELYTNIYYNEEPEFTRGTEMHRSRDLRAQQ